MIPGLGLYPGEGMETHSSIFDWRIPWTEESGRLRSMGLQRVRHDWVTKHARTCVCVCACMHTDTHTPLHNYLFACCS